MGVSTTAPADRRNGSSHRTNRYWLIKWTTLFVSSAFVANHIYNESQPPVGVSPATKVVKKDSHSPSIVDGTSVGPQNAASNADSTIKKPSSDKRTSAASVGVHNAPLAQKIPLPSQRTLRFPSVEERVRLYSSDWYLPPCSNYEEGKTNYRIINSTAVRVQGPLRKRRRQYTISNVLAIDDVFLMDRETAINCSRHKITRNGTVADHSKEYCLDAAHKLLPTLDRLLSRRPELRKIPVLLQYGDSVSSRSFGAANLPVIKKFRPSATWDVAQSILTNNSTETCMDAPRQPIIPVDLQPFVWNFQSSRHFGRPLPIVLENDIPWEQKMPKAVWRGALTGGIRHVDKSKLTNLGICKALPRCHLVLTHAKSELVDAGLTTTRKRLPDKIRGVRLLKDKLEMEQQLRYKAIISMEGNDVSTGLKWALLSKSVVLMPPPTFTSWAMEELLEPWIHYVPLNHNGTDAEEKMEWVVRHDAYARRIAIRGSMWIHDLVHHPNATTDDELIQEQILERYFAQYAPFPPDLEPST